ncbi:MAG: radical SAM protein [Candidatus Aminicenantes bacterium]|nr:radical SAM protein [Candidatus Aminicenantes bacterium]NIM80441.1 radical SAM protein [Candidatus Aminicenantes bacterium]NIN19834.1 radical SAM protein [Candidatus Aminicenantes bacterium]NIN43710.1 radical SAM protein [Candidatus Aminicenantes bacterium]NIN86460.1 radical SAM protein [Candidatus Aminicenantes bacterium]
MEPKPTGKTKEIAFSSRIELPLKITYRQVEDKHLFIAPHNPTWIVTNDIGAFMLSPLREGYTIQDVLNFSVSQLGLTREKSLAEMKDLLMEIEARGFYRNIPPREVNPKDNLPSLQLFITRSCNIRCIHCYMDAGLPMDDELTLEEWKSVIDIFTDIYGKGWVTLSGGEPLCRDDFFEIADYVKKKGHHLYLLTNGTLIKDMETAKRIAQGVDDIQISLDGASREATDRIRGKGVFDKVVKAIDLMKQVDMKIKLAFMIFPENLKDLEENLVPLVLSFDYPRISINIDDRPTNLGRATQFPPGSFMSPIHYRHSIDKIMREIWAKGWAKRPTGILNHRLTTCGMGNGFTVDANGDVYPCPLPICKFGNLRQDDLVGLAKKTTRLREETSVERMEKCTDCDLKYICIGSCRILNYQVNGDFLVPSCNEQSKKIILYRMIDRWI